MAGWIKLPRNITSHPLWNNPQYAVWYIDLLIMSNHADRTLVDKSAVYVLANGQVRASVADLCERWGTKGNKNIISFLNLLAQFGLIKRELLFNRVSIINVYLPDDEQCNNAEDDSSFFEHTQQHTQQHTDGHTDGQPREQTIYKNIENIEKEKNNITHTHYAREALSEKDFSVSDRVDSDEEKKGDGADGEKALRNKLLADEQWQLTVARFFGEKAAEVPALVQRFLDWCDASGSNSHRDVRDLQSHFAAWYNRFRSAQPPGNKSSSAPKNKSSSASKNTSAKTFKSTTSTNLSPEEIASKYYNKYYDPNKKHDRRLPFEPSLPRDPSAYYEPL